jgi:hypothetical protein
VPAFEYFYVFLLLIGSILFLSHDRFLPYSTNSLICVGLCK